MARGKKKDESPQLAALRFVSLAQAEIGNPYQTHCRFINGEIMAYDGVLAAGTPIEGELNVCPNTFKLLRAFERATGQYSLSLLDTKQLAVKTNSFRALVPCLDWENLPYVAGDPRQYPLNDKWRQAASLALTFTREGATAVAYAAGLTKDGSIVGTNGNVLIEAWHGVPTPPGLIIPQRFVKALEKIAKPLEGFGYSDSSFTVYFADGSWLRTQLYINERFPPIDRIFAYTDAAKPVDIPKGLFEAMRAVKPFNDVKRVYFVDGAVQSHAEDTQGARHTVKGLEGEASFNPDHLLDMETFAKSFDVSTNDGAVCVFGEQDDIKIRAVISKMVT